MRAAEKIRSKTAAMMGSGYGLISLPQARISCRNFPRWVIASAAPLSASSRPWQNSLSGDLFGNSFAAKTNMLPDMSRDGKIIVMDLPVKEFGAAGRAAQVMFKYMWQQAMERDEASTHDLPAVFLWADEAQNFVSEYDSQFQATARSSRACTVYITQNLPNYYASMGGEQAKPRVDSLVGNFATQNLARQHQRPTDQRTRRAGDRQSVANHSGSHRVYRRFGGELWQQRGPGVRVRSAAARIYSFSERRAAL